MSSTSAEPIVRLQQPQPSRPRNTRQSRDDLVATWRKRQESARRDRRRYEPQWHINQAFAAGKQWLAWAPRERRLILPPMPDGRERYTADVLTNYLWTAAGKIMADDFRPELLFRRDDVQAEEFAEQANNALSYGWDNEWNGDKVLRELVPKLLVYGTVAVRCRYDKAKGPVLARNVPHLNGKPITDPEQAHAAVAASMQGGPQVTFKDIQGKVVWEPLSPFNVLVPPGIESDQNFPWEIIVAPRHLDDLKDEFGAAAAKVEAETMLNIDVMGVREAPLADSDLAYASTGGKLEDHALVFTCYDRINNQVITYAGKDHLLDVQNSLPYESPDGEPRSGIAYFHYWRVPGRFWSRALIEPGIGPQRALNKRRSQQSETIDRGQAMVIAEEGSIRQMPTGKPVQVLEMKPGSPKPDFSSGIAPGPWMQADVEQIKQDIETALGFHAISQGDHPAGVSAYAALALLAENDQVKLDPILQEFKASIRVLVENSVFDIRRYWPASKQIAIAGPDGMLESTAFNASKIPSFFMVEVAKGGTKPRSQGAQIQEIYDIFQQAAVVGQALPVEWLKESLDAGKPAPLPAQDADSDAEKAGWENDQMAQGVPVVPAYHDPPQVHIPIHREQQVQAEIAGNQQVVLLIEDHIRRHQELAAQNAQVQAQQAFQAGAFPPPPDTPQQPAQAAGGPPQAGGGGQLNSAVVKALQNSGRIGPRPGIQT